jgi:hypothetical protein
VLYVEGHVRRQPQALARHLNCERRACLEGVCEAPKLGHELRPRVSALDVAATILSHESSSVLLGTLQAARFSKAAPPDHECEWKDQGSQAEQHNRYQAAGQ